MEKICILKSDGEELQLPVGFRFRPTDQELLLYYLKPKVQSLPLPAAFIPQIDEIFHSHPSLLPGDVNQRRYFFCKRKWDYSKTCRSRINKISDDSGYWKEVGNEKSISVDAADPNTSLLLGSKKSFVLYQGKHPRASKTSWFLHEYRLSPSQISAASTMDSENWVAYRIYQRKRRSKNTKKMIGEVGSVMESMNIDSTIEFGSPPLSSPLSSSNDEEV